MASFNSINPSPVTPEKNNGWRFSGNSAAISVFNSSSSKSDLEIEIKNLYPKAPDCILLNSFSRILNS
jgi:hypothetical protein